MGVVVFTAPCPSCGSDATWHQSSGSGYTVTPGDFTIPCLSCGIPADEAV